MKPNGEDLADWAWIVVPIGSAQSDVPRASGWYSGRE